MRDRDRLIELLWSHPCDGKECAFCEHLEPFLDSWSFFGVKISALLCLYAVFKVFNVGLLLFVS